MTKKSFNQLRIIGGLWRGRKISFPELSEIRPTPDRVRETLFNWLQPNIEGAYCLDLFAGSGALGFEALSRGAKHVVFVDKSPVVIEQLRATAQLLNANQITLYQGHAPESLMLPHEPFDIVFLDPPFHHTLIKPSLQWLVDQKLITPNTLIYIEVENRKGNGTVPDHCTILKEGKTREVYYCLAQLDDGGKNPINNESA